MNLGAPLSSLFKMQNISARRRDKINSDEEERVRLVYAVKVRVTGDPGFELKPGLPADVELRTGDS